MRLAIRFVFLFAILGTVSTAAASQMQVFGRPRHVAEPGFTIYVGSADKAYLKDRGIELGSNVLIAFPESSMVVTADGYAIEDGSLVLKGNSRIRIDTDAKAIIRRIVELPDWNASKIQLP